MSQESNQVAGLPIPLVMLVGGVALGVLLALVCRGLVAGTARTRAATADHRLRQAVHEVATELVVDPVAAELTSYATVHAALEATLK